MASARRAKKMVTIRSSGGVTRAVNGDVAPEPSTLREGSKSMPLSEVRIMRRPPPKQELLDAVKEARREIFAAIKSGDFNSIAPCADDDASPRTQSPQPSPPPPPTYPPAGAHRIVPAPRMPQSPAWGGAHISPGERNIPVEVEDLLVYSQAAVQMVVFTERNPPPKCRHCNVFFVTFASVDCRHADACFACASYLLLFFH